MSKIKFIHTDYLRLATPVSGIADAPGWLQQLASHGVRQAARNVIDTAIAHEVDFVLIAGGISDSPVDLPAAVAWFSDQSARLKQHGIQVVAVANDFLESSLLKSVCDLVVTTEQSIYASKPLGHRCNLSIDQTVAGHNQDVVVCVGHQQSVVSSQLVYNAMPAIQSSANCNSTTQNGMLSVSAGAIQAVNPDETSDFGCVLVQADSELQELRSEFIVTDVMRFASEELHLSASTTVESLSAAIREASESIGKSLRQTVIVDWCVDARLVSNFSEVSRFCETEILQQLRSDVQSVHRGVWSRRLEFTAESNLQVTSPVLESIEEYIEVVSGASSRFDRNRFTPGQRMLQGESGVDPTLISGLGLLGRVA